MVLIPLNSGQVFTCPAKANLEFFEHVLIPLNSGQVFTWNSPFQKNNLRSLNPFEFRAGIYFRVERASASNRACLNPFEFRAGIYFARPEKLNLIIKLHRYLKKDASIVRANLEIGTDFHNNMHSRMKVLLARMVAFKGFNSLLCS